MKKQLDSKTRKKRTPAKKKAEEEIYFLKGKVVACVNGKTYEVKAD